MIVRGKYEEESLSIELTAKDKWWVEKVLEKENINLNEEEDFIEINFFQEGEYWYPCALFDKKSEEVDDIEVYSVEEIREVLESEGGMESTFLYYFKD